MDGNIALAKHMFLPSGHFSKSASRGDRLRHQVLPAEAIRLFEQRDIVAALGGDTSRSHPRRSSPDDGDAFWPRRRPHRANAQMAFPPDSRVVHTPHPLTLQQPH